MQLNIIKMYSLNKLKGHIRALNIMQHKTFILREKFFLFAVLSFVLYWMRAVNCDINLYNIGKLMVGLLINIPLFFLASSNLRVLLRKILGGKHIHLKLCAYTIIISFFYSIFITEKLVYLVKYSYSSILFMLTIFHVWQPLFIIFLGYLFIAKFDVSRLNIKVFIFIIVALAVHQGSGFLIAKHFSFAKYHIYNLTLLKVYFYNNGHYFTLYRILGIHLILMIIMLSNISFSHIGFNKKWNKKTIILTASILCIMIANQIFVITTTNIQFTKEGLVWNILTAFYGIIIASLIEETIFRGIIQNYITKKLYPIKDFQIIAIIITSLLFGLYHYPFINIAFSSAFISGFILGWIYHVTQNLWTSILVHGLNNLIATVIVH